MRQLAASEGQPGNWEEPGFSLRRLEAAKPQAEGWQEPCESRGSRTELWEPGSEIPLGYPTHQSNTFQVFGIPLLYQYHPIVFVFPKTVHLEIVYSPYETHTLAEVYKSAMYTQPVLTIITLHFAYQYTLSTMIAM